jgi:hypothetical protein
VAEAVEEAMLVVAMLGVVVEVVVRGAMCVQLKEWVMGGGVRLPQIEAKLRPHRDPNH